MSQEASAITLDDLRLLCGELKDDADSSKRFREFILEEKWKLSDLDGWIKQAILKKFDKEFQDIVVALGKRVGFTPEFGRYEHGGQGRIGYDGIWRNAEGLVLVIEAKLGSWIRRDVGQLGSYIEGVASQSNISGEKVFGLYVVGDPSDLSALADQVRGSKYSGKIRIISSENILKLTQFYEEFGLRNEQAAKLLVPIDSVNVGELVDLIETVIQEEAIRTETPQPIPELPRAVEIGDIPSTSRGSLSSLTDGEVVVCPSRPEGVDFLKRYNAWGFVKIGREPRYFALYVSSPDSAVRYFAEIEKIVDPKSSESPVNDPERYKISEGKRLILFRKDSLRELADPLARGERWPQGKFYLTLSRLIKAKSLDDIISQS
jgi:hypothetical protein